MNIVNKSDILDIREFNRFYTRILGLVNQFILDSPFTLMEARILFDIGYSKECCANLLTKNLSIDPGHLSRILRKFEDKGYITKEKSKKDARTYMLNLTNYGKEVLNDLEEKSNNQIHQLIHDLDKYALSKLISSMKYIEETLKCDMYPINIRSFKLKDINHIIDRHEKLYKSEYGFDKSFKNYVSDAIYKFTNTFDKDNENIWIAEHKGKTIGSIALVKVDNTTAQLRWFLIEPNMRGAGLGKRLISTLLYFARQKGYTHIFLDTISDVHAARHLYKSNGFILSNKHSHNIWGKRLTEERWTMNL